MTKRKKSVKKPTKERLKISKKIDLSLSSSNKFVNYGVFAICIGVAGFLVFWGISFISSAQETDFFYAECMNLNGTLEGDICYLQSGKNCTRTQFNSTGCDYQGIDLTLCGGYSGADVCGQQFVCARMIFTDGSIRWRTFESACQACNNSYVQGFIQGLCVVESW